EVAVLSHGLWRQRYGSDPHVIGRTLDLDNRDLTIVGVMPAGFDYPEGAELWTPEPFANPVNQERSFRFLDVIGRLGQRASLRAAQDEGDAVADRLAKQYPTSDAGRGVRLQPLAAHVVGPVGATLALMMLAAILVLAIACANVANLLLAQAVGRWREMALRTSLGATRAHLVRQLTAEGLVLAGLAGGLGWLLAALLMPVLRSLRPPGLSQLASVRMGAETLAFMALAIAVTALWFGLAPAWEVLRPRPERSLLRLANTGGAGNSRLPAWVVAAEVAACVVLVVGAGLLLQSLRRLQRADPGFQAGHAITFRMSLLFNSLQELYANAPFFTHLNDRLQKMPGVEAAGLTSARPFAPPVLAHFHVPGSATGAGVGDAQRTQAGLRRVLPGYFRAIGIPLRGRDFTEGDDTRVQHVVIVSQRLEAVEFPGGDALGKELDLGSGPKPITARIVGVAGNVPEQGLGGAPGEDIYVPFLQIPNPDMSAVVRARGDPMQMLPALRGVVAELNPQVSIYDVAALDQV
ncbi:MAG: ABC transporter permease, partial [Streptosporangiaceae bacterium]